MTELEKKWFKAKYGDRSGITVWGFHDQKNIWAIKRKSGNVQYYAHQNDFNSQTKVDLTEQFDAPFRNPSNDPRRTSFKLFLENQVNKKFEGMKTTESFVKKVKGVHDPITNRIVKKVMWPPTKQMIKTPIVPQLPDGSLWNMQF